MNYGSGGAGIHLDGYDFRRLGGDRYSQVPLMAEWAWSIEARRVGNYLTRMYQTDPLLRALVQVRVGLTLGTRGLRFKSKWRRDDNGTFDDKERRIQTLIDRLNSMSYEGVAIDAGATMTRMEIETAIIVNKCLSTDGIAVKVVREANQVRRGEFRTKWRMVNPNRVMNPAKTVNYAKPQGNQVPNSAVPTTSLIWEGIEYDSVTNKRVAMWINIEPPSKDQAWFSVSEKDKFVRIPYEDEDGNQIIIHDFNPIQAGQFRGFPLAAPFLFPLLQLQGTTEAHIVSNRVKASHPMFMKTDDADTVAAFELGNAVVGPNKRVQAGTITLLPTDSEMVFPNMTFNGDDYGAFMDYHVRNIASSWELPYQYVLAEIKGVSMSSGRLFIDRAQKTGTGWQNHHINKVTHVIDASINQEGILRGSLPISSVSKAGEGAYMRPRAASMDPGKDAKRALDMMTAGVAPSTVYEEVWGLDFEEQMIIGNRDRMLAENLGFTLPTSTEPEVEEVEEVEDEPDTADTESNPPVEDEEDDSPQASADNAGFIAKLKAALTPKRYFRNNETGAIEVDDTKQD